MPALSLSVSLGWRFLPVWSVEMSSTHGEEIVAILDAGSQYGKVIDRRIRELNVETELLPIGTEANFFTSKYKAIVISGGPQSVYDVGAPKIDPKLFDLGIPILGICYGMQLMCFLGGKVVGKKASREDGQFIIKVDTTSELYANLEEEQSVLLTHGDTVFEAPGNDWKVTATSGSLIASIEHTQKHLYGVQFHPEVDLTLNGTIIFRNFLFGISKLNASFTLKDRQQTAIEYIQQKVGPESKVLVLVSGGVDSAVCAALVTKAIGPDRVHALHISNGFMRKHESERVTEALAKLDLKLRVVDASETFYSAKTFVKASSTGLPVITERLDCTIHPEEKRKIIGDTFMHVAQAEIARLGLKVENTFLAQGTLRPDLIESASHTVSKVAEVIKTHHNDTDLVRELRQKGHVIEPLADYHKDEVRAIGRSLGLPETLVSRQPFPGPGLAIRIICADQTPDIDPSFHQTNSKLNFLLQNFDPNHFDLMDININSELTQNPSNSQELKETTSNDHNNSSNSKLSDYSDGSSLSSSSNIPSELAELRSEEKTALKALLKTNHISAHLLPLKTVGVQGDGRSYKYLCALSCDNPHGTEEFFQPDWIELFGLAKLLPKIYHNINRVVYVFGPRLTSPITDITPTKLTKDVISQLQEADDIVNSVFIERDQMKGISQAPIILFPVPFDQPKGYRSIAIRTLITNDFMTGAAAVPGIHIDADALLEAAKRVSRDVPGIARVVYDLTSKPPATTEWE